MRDKYDDILRDKLGDLEMLPSAADWDIIERGLGMPARKTIPLGKYIAVAASLLLVVALGVYFLTGYDALESTLPSNEQVLIERNDAEEQLPPLVRGIMAVNETVKAKEQGMIEAAKALDAHAVAVREERHANEMVLEETESSGEQPKNVNEDAVRSTQNNISQPVTQGRRSVDVAEVELPRRLPKLTPLRNDLSLSFFADGGLSNSSGKTTGNNLLASASMPGLTQVDQTNVNSTIFTHGDYTHNMPLSFGISFRKNFSDRWGVESGIVYSYLYSKASISSAFIERSKRRQQAHYLGIPVSVVYSIWRSPNLEVYVKGGGTVDFNIHTRVKDEFTANGTTTSRSDSFNAGGVQWSVAANAGIMYNISPIFGVYLEPGISYYFSEDRQPYTFWQENPTNFNLKIGFRTNF